MKLLIVGLGYAGQRYRRAFRYLAGKLNLPLDMAYVGRHERNSETLPYYPDVSRALAEFHPDVVVVSVNDHGHVGILRDLAGFEGFVLCEKPLATPYDDWPSACAGLAHAQGFALDLVERYSEATQRLKDQVVQQEWSLIRASFHWGKNRLNDYRPTCGVSSEVIHALDLVRWIGAPDETLRVRQAIGIGSDFSLSGPDVPDTVMLTATLGEAVVAGYSSFVNIQRQRTLDFSFADAAGQIFHARLVYDTPAWDRDELRVWTRDGDGREVLMDEYHTSPGEAGLETLLKLSRLCEDVLHVTALDSPPRQPFAGLDDSIGLQRLLDGIGQQLGTPPLGRYVRGAARQLIPASADLESLG
ncbi:Gfo/Idh/MocA family oxidoreductase [Cupriavidus sp. MP-37]|uniref:Gfo/Idh/MocA family oxidoreductase n=1 Tax=Cupriavidus sp. MP-37 TaxID=2884455 RepID=UPI001D0BB376|nr:Gfo/Idh/MocA family oxidoreductase [Cupriavidus sp. MP-37]UDM48808.1 Gfo/Idh/MocA family oxidoreductase [Cupriavidus sp. MP-37]